MHYKSICILYMKFQRKITKRIRSRKNKRTLRRKRYSRKRRGGEEKEKCCMCGKKINSSESMVPRECLMKYGKYRAHKICPECWWGEFAKEGATHKCPGCVKNIPVLPDPHAGEVIDLTTD